MNQTAKERFDHLEQELKTMGEENPGQIFQKLERYTEAKDLAGDLWALWSKKARDAKTARKEVINQVKIFGAVLAPETPRTNIKGLELEPVEAREATTDKMREAMAELIAKPYEDTENAYQSAADHYKVKNESITEKINVLKKKYEHMKEVLGGKI